MELGDMDWLNEAPTLAAIRRDTPFSVPSGYFENLSENLKAQALLESVRFENKEEFKLPENYFEQLPGRIEDRIALEKIHHLVPSEGYIVPDTYFSQLSVRINSRIKEERSVIKRKTIFSTWASYSAAAAITMLIGTVIYFNSTGYTIGKQLSDVPDQEIINYLQIHSTVNDMPYIIENINPEGMKQITTDVSSDELEQYINSTTL